MDYKKYQSALNNLRKYRKEKGLTQERVATSLGLKNKTLISRWEHGDALPSIASAVRLSVLYRVSLDDLFVGLRESLSGVLIKTHRSNMSGMFVYCSLRMLVLHFMYAYTFTKNIPRVYTFGRYSRVYFFFFSFADTRRNGMHGASGKPCVW